MVSIIEKVINNIELEKKVETQRKEINILNERCRILSEQLKIIRDVDYYKSRLSKISNNIPYKAIIQCKDFEREITTIFNKPHSECLEFYKDLLDKRNQIVHRFTITQWDSLNSPNQYKRKITKKSLTDLCDELAIR